MRKRIAIAMTIACGLVAPASAAPGKDKDKDTAPAKQPGDPSDAQQLQEHAALNAAQNLAHDAGVAMEHWIEAKSISEDKLFARVYFPVAKTSPQRYVTAYDPLAEKDLIGLEDKALLSDITFQYAIVTDTNGYIPVHDTRFSKPLTGNAVQDYANNRTKRMLGDAASLIAARSEAPHLILRTKLETGEVVYDLSVPITVHGKHWGCARIGFKRVE